MGCIAWDGIFLAADGHSQIDRVSDGLVAAIGPRLHGLKLIEWAKGDRKPAGWSRTHEDEAATLIHITKSGIFIYRGDMPAYANPIFEKAYAWGSGKDFALAVMFCGKTAVEAVHVARIFDTSCAAGTNTLTLDEGSEQ